MACSIAAYVYLNCVYKFAAKFSNKNTKIIPICKYTMIITLCKSASEKEENGLAWVFCLCIVWRYFNNEKCTNLDFNLK